MSVTLSFIDERQFLTVIQPVLPLHECANPTPTKFATEPLHSVAGSITAEDLLLTLLLLTLLLLLSLFILLLTLLVLVLL
jgi:hypothetical protein